MFFKVKTCEEVFEIIKTLKPSARDEYEITDVNNTYIEAGTMTFEVLECWWTDAGTSFESLLRANNMVASWVKEGHARR